MPAKGKVSLVRQTIYCFIPIMDLYAAYHIKKLRWYLVIMLLVGIPLSITLSEVFPLAQPSDYDKIMLEDQIDWGYVFLGDNPDDAVASWIIYHVIIYAIAVYLIRRWSKNWNIQFEE